MERTLASGYKRREQNDREIVSTIDESAAGCGYPRDRGWPAGLHSNVTLREKNLRPQRVLTMPRAEMHAPGADTADGYWHAMGRCFLCNFFNEEGHVHYR